MKTKLLLTLGATLLTIVAIKLNASTTLLTPRAATNQPKVAMADSAAIVVAPKVESAVLLTPKAAGNQILTVKAEPARFVPKCQLAGTPRAITAAGSSARMICCGMTVAACENAGACAKSN
jgi:hypothetical protein